MKLSILQSLILLECSAVRIGIDQTSTIYLGGKVQIFWKEYDLTRSCPEKTICCHALVFMFSDISSPRMTLQTSSAVGTYFSLLVSSAGGRARDVVMHLIPLTLWKVFKLPSVAILKSALSNIY
ncbi:hypothetical protein AVEN_191047-1 [Araneus ventricosus]|uniref:Uncharacterized protein n=1 Tax=Araneus ventricosus TaxID=182803 RepID=A0A4Y2B0F7_ARAVE|nr:hypothetical protein AVEN_191047-1 [Araneus ventricosus]